MRKIIISVLYILLLLCNAIKSQTSNSAIEKKIDSLIKLMTIEEKIGQLIQYSSEDVATGPTGEKFNIPEEIKKGRVGSVLNVIGVKKTTELQKIAIEQSRLKIPLIFGLDVIHGYKTIFPIPLGEASSWDLEAIEKSARVSATEASAAGISWTFAPMVDIARDPRWGRIMEGAGEDTYYGSLVAVARVRGFQGKNLKDINSIAACAKHYAAYGATIAGRDYSTVDISDITLHEIYLPPFKACVDEGVATFMCSFNEINGVPSSGNKYLNNILLKKEWGFKGFIVSDWNSIGEMINHGNVKNKYEAAEAALNAGIDMDMESYCYLYEAKNLLNDKKVTIQQIDEAVRRILRIKFKLGLFDNPYRGCTEAREKENILNKKNLETARDVARKSIVLLKNENNILPLKKDISSIAVIGPLADSKKDMLGFSCAQGDANDCATLLQGIKNPVS